MTGYKPIETFRIGRRWCLKFLESYEFDYNFNYLKKICIKLIDIFAN